MVIYVKNKYIIIILLILGIIGLVLYFFISNMNTSNPEYTVQKSESTINVIDNNTNVINETPKVETPPKETEISSFTTKIYSKDSGRQNNIRITCSTLNDTYVENGETFSFCSTVGQATTSKGYQKAEIFDNKRKCKTWSWRWKLSDKYYFI